MVALIKRVTGNIAAKPRHDTMEGRDYIVVPAIIMAEGVLNGNKGPLFYGADEMAANVWAWNYRPVVVYHPQINGEYVSAAHDPSLLTTHKIGVLMNTQFRPANGKEPAALVSECWVEVERLKLVDNRILTAIEEGRMLELSTGLFSDEEDGTGEWGGKAYVSIATHFVPDHLAILPDQTGACSISDGCGFLRANTAQGQKLVNLKFEAYQRALKTFEVAWGGKVNAMSFSEIQSALWEALNRKFGEKGYSWNGYVDDVFDGYCIYCIDGHTYRHDYIAGPNGVELTGQPIEVHRVIEYTPTGNAGGKDKENVMDKKVFVDGLIAHKETKWSEEDRTFLMALEEKQLEKFGPLAASSALATNTGQSGCDCLTENKGEPKKEANKEGKEEPKTYQQHIDEMPPELREVMQEGILARNQLRTNLIAAIKANTANTLSDEDLAKRSMADLRAFAALANAAKPRQGEDISVFNFEGAAGGPQLTAHVEEPLLLPTLNFEQKKETAA